ncbi:MULTISPECIES: S1 RNA-binding domain-containing protein [Exiguobacterium]|uniref:CvfB family protein n=1 Tax=Exiguobacterium TaxID=33986 RepID=UPI0008778929|nr:MULTISPECIES: S1-like domain-containing RNA-binding protein [Exiguobacterium]TCI35060.1 DNA-binding protein [Exiguobacterium sp. SH4S7]TCI44607.1 DNA-binding protein [Exiguobacterium sp. SH5S32]TCI51013.1 DNA-binding protein [Exiguobacterium sp. SH1S4]TCI59755.1 DNA-binding protein [Exiguobacterium sp. SH0S2]TCI69988.1 DNA-binding protein [Exiguobacterium sp. SH1S1]
MVLRAGDVVDLVAERSADFGVFIGNGREEVLLHRKEQTEEVTVGQTVRVFLYHDSEGRLASTMTIPNVSFEEYEWFEVTGVRYNTGVFVNIGIQKDVLVSLDDLPENRTYWPKEGDKLCVRLKYDQKGRLLGEPAHYAYLNLLARPAKEEWGNQDVQAIVVNKRDVGVNVWVENESLGFLHEAEMTRWPRLGEQLAVRVTQVKQDGTVLVSMKPRAYEAIDPDAESIRSYIEERGGEMPYGDKTAPDVIDREFGMSKAAFKRALGKLLKEKQVEKLDNGYKLK